MIQYKLFPFFIFMVICLPFISAQQTLTKTMMADGIERTYILYIPASYDGSQAFPLVLNFHGYGSNANEQMYYGDFRGIAIAENFILAHPLGTLDNSGSTHWNVGWGGSTVDDINFVSLLIDKLADDYLIDTDRVYSTGMSNGGFMSYALACGLSDKIAAIASVTGSMTIGQTSNCNPSHPMPVMEIHGTADAVVEYNGSFPISIPIPDVIKYWLEFNNIEADPDIQELPNASVIDGSTVTHFVYPSNEDGIELEHYRINGGGHTWPGSIFDIGGTNYDMNASKEIWRFFAQYDINGRITTSTAQTENQEIILYPVPAGNYITISNVPRSNVSFQIFGAHGEKHMEGQLFSRETKIDIQNLANGMYIILIENQPYRFIKQS